MWQWRRFLLHDAVDGFKYKTIDCSSVIQNNTSIRLLRRSFASLMNTQQNTKATKTMPEEPILEHIPSRYRLYPNEIHCLIGLNGSGKTNLLRTLEKAESVQSSTGKKCRVASLSLDAHRAFVSNHGHQVVADVLGGIAAPSARDLIVRLGLFPVWDSHVKYLSTGELRKLMLAHTLLQTPRPEVLIMDQPFDGLDVSARRQLKWMLGQLTRGFTRLLVDTGGRNEAFAYKTQVILVANRLEQVFPDILSHIVLLKKDYQSKQGHNQVEIFPWRREKDDQEDDIMLQQLQSFFVSEEQKTVKSMTKNQAIGLIQELFDCATTAATITATAKDSSEHPAIELHDFSVAYDTKQIFEGTSLVRGRHEHWALLGPNGSGKSSLTRVLMRSQGHGKYTGKIQVFGESLENGHRDIYSISTDNHLELLELALKNQDITALEMIQQLENQTTRVDVNSARLAARLLRIDDTLLKKSFAKLSQGEQKIVLIARGLAYRPRILILDEISHGLDPFNRSHVLAIIDLVAKHSGMHLIMITHHEEEIGECFDTIIRIEDKKLKATRRDKQLSKNNI
jgi:molybdate transport system ATP-binding protein